MKIGNRINSAPIIMKGGTGIVFCLVVFIKLLSLRGCFFGFFLFNLQGLFPGAFQQVLDFFNINYSELLLYAVTG